MITAVISDCHTQLQLGDCLNGIKPYVRDLIIVTPSTDTSFVELAHICGGTLVHTPFPDDYASLFRSIAERVATEWLWLIRAGERPTPAAGAFVSQFVTKCGNDVSALELPVVLPLGRHRAVLFGNRVVSHRARVLRCGRFVYSEKAKGILITHGVTARPPLDPNLAIELDAPDFIARYISEINRSSTVDTVCSPPGRRIPHWKQLVREIASIGDSETDLNRLLPATALAGLTAIDSTIRFLKQLERDSQAGIPINVEDLPSLRGIQALIEEEDIKRQRQYPTPPFGIKWRCYESASPMNRTVQLLKHVVAGSRPVAISGMSAADLSSPSIEDVAFVRLLERGRLPAAHVSVTDAGVNVPQVDCDSVFNVLVARNLASDRSETMAEAASAYDEFWTDTAESRQQLRRNGFPPERVRVVDLRGVAGDHESENIPYEGMSAEVEAAVSSVENRYRPLQPMPVNPDSIQVVIHGDFWAGHSLSKLNHVMALGLSCQDILVRCEHVQLAKEAIATKWRERRIEALMSKEGARSDGVTIRHTYPPHWDPPPKGAWIHMQPWEYSKIPPAWLPHLAKVDELWVPSRFTRDAFCRSGVDERKIQVIPHGIDACEYHPSIVPRHLPTTKSFRFLFVGGTLRRKGIDLLLQAFIEEFRRHEDVALVIKDLGTASFYKTAHHRDQILALCKDPTLPEIIYIDDFLTEGQLASLYTACHCLVAPYRGEGFGLPILEAMASGLAPIVPVGGPTEDFLPADGGIRIPSESCVIADPMFAPGTCELKIEVAELRSAMRAAFVDQVATRAMGLASSRHAHDNFQWESVLALMQERIRAVNEQAKAARRHPAIASTRPHSAPNHPRIVAIIVGKQDSRHLGDTLCSVQPLCDRSIVLSDDLSDRGASIASEYGASPVQVDRLHLQDMQATWAMLLNSGEYVSDEDADSIRTGLTLAAPNVAAIRIPVRQPGVETAYRAARLFRWSPQSLSLIRSPSDAESELARRGEDVVDLARLLDTCTRRQIEADAQAMSFSSSWLIPWLRPSGNIFVDVGAGNGEWSMLLSRTYQNVHLVEPSQDRAARIRRWLLPHMTLHQVIPWNNGAMTGTKPYADIADQEDLQLSRRELDAESGTEPAPLDKLSILGSVDLIKCSVSGATARCLEGARGLISRDRPWLLIEIDESQQMPRITSLLQEWSYHHTIVRNPAYSMFSDLWNNRYWLACQPSAPG